MSSSCKWQDGDDCWSQSRPRLGCREGHGGLHHIRIKALCPEIFGEHDTILWTATRDSILSRWDMASREPHYDTLNWTAVFEGPGSELYAREPYLAVFCTHLKRVVIVYRGEHLIL